MDARRESEPASMQNRTTEVRKSERELEITRIFNGPARIVFEAWTKPELLKRWWVPKSTGMSLLSCEADCSHGWHIPFRARPRGLEAYDILWQVHRSNTGLAPCLD
jgi:hypothetical protein